MLFLGAPLAACVATWFTFLPSFIFILAGGPLVESSRGQLHVTAPLAAITCAVVGVIASLGVFFVGHIAWTPAGPDFAALALMALALFALLRLRAGVIPVILGSGAAGLALRLAGWA